MQTEVEIEIREVKAVTELLPQWVQEFKGCYQSDVWAKNVLHG